MSLLVLRLQMPNKPGNPNWIKKLADEHLLSEVHIVINTKNPLVGARAFQNPHTAETACRVLNQRADAVIWRVLHLEIE